MTRLSELFANITKIRLMGGEPLLHPEINTIVALARTRLPRSEIHLVTNGVLLSQMTKDFWSVCKKNRVKIDVSRYPLAIDFRGISELAASHGVQMELSVEISDFIATTNPKGDSNPVAAMRQCRSLWYCPFVRDGRIYPCAISALAHYYNAAFGAAFPGFEGIDIHQHISGWTLLDALEMPISQCACCATVYRSYKWGHSKCQAEEWSA